MALVPSISEGFCCPRVPPEAMDRLWATGWRHFGETFFRYSTSEDEEGPRTIQPLRIDLEVFSLSRSQKRTLKRNADMEVSHRWLCVDEEEEALFQRHKKRFRANVPEQLSDFLGEPGKCPCACLAIRCHLDDALVAASYLDLGHQSSSAVYGTFDPEWSRRGLGLFTMLVEIHLSMQMGLRYYYPGYATREPGLYDYKKRFNGLEQLDWSLNEWTALERSV